MGSSIAASSRSSLRKSNACGAVREAVPAVVRAVAEAALVDEADVGQVGQVGQEGPAGKAAVPRDPQKRATGRHGRAGRNNVCSDSAIRCLETRAVIRVRDEDNPCTMPRLLHSSLSTGERRRCVPT